MTSFPPDPPPRLGFTQVQTGRAFEGISSQIREAMASGTLKPGSRLPPERTLSVQFGVSRNTLREALRTLESSGVLQLRRGAHAGAYIKQSNGQGVATGLLDMYKLGALTPSQLTEARILVETAVVRSACANCTKEDIETLRTNLLRAIEYDKAGLVEERISTNLEFHRLLAAATHNPLLVTLMNAVMDVMQVFVRTIGPYDARFVFASRRRFIARMEAHDETGAAMELEKGLRQLQRRYLSRLHHA